MEIDSMAKSKKCVRDSLDHLTKSGQLILRADAPTQKKGTSLTTLFRDQITPIAVTCTSPKRDIVLRASSSPRQQDRATVTLEGRLRPVSSTAVGSPENSLEGRVAPICVFFKPLSEYIIITIQSPSNLCTNILEVSVFLYSTFHVLRIHL